MCLIIKGPEASPTLSISDFIERSAESHCWGYCCWIIELRTYNLLKNSSAIALFAWFF